MTRLQYLWHQVTCLLSGTCSLFGGDDYTEWLEAQQRASKRSAEQLRAMRPDHGPIEDAIFPVRSKEDRP